MTETNATAERADDATWMRCSRPPSERAGRRRSRGATPSTCRSSEIKDAVLRMGALVEEAIRRARSALTTHDAELALDVIKADARDQRRPARGLAARSA